MRAVWLTCVASLMCSSMALAGSYRHQGRVLDANGVALQGPQSVVVHLYTSESGSSVWSESHPDTPMQGGYYTIEIGGNTPIPGQYLDGRSLWISVHVGGVAGERQPLLEVPLATTASRMRVSSEPPGTCDVGMIGAFYFDTDDSFARLCDGSEWSLMGVANLPATSPTVSVTPERPKPGDALTCGIDAPGVDPEGQTVTYDYTWLLNGAPTANVGATLPGSATSSAQLWTCEARSDDGNSLSEPGTASERIGVQAFHDYTGADQSFTVPAWSTEIVATMWAGAGGGGQSENGSHWGGSGGFLQARLGVTGGESLTVLVGRGGDVSDGFGYAAYPNGGHGSARNGYRTGGGGGRSAILRGSTELLVAGGGGGAGATGGSIGSNRCHGGGGGYPAGGDGSSIGYAPNCVGSGGTQSAGGNTLPACGVSNDPGSKNQGAHGGLFFQQGTHPFGAENSGGGGGDGYYGGGSGHLHAGGGGGSTYYAAGAVDVNAPGPTDNGVPNGTGAADYAAGIAVGANDAVGGNGRVVIWAY